jgi:multiple antibiotic resistance protein
MELALSLIHLVFMGFFALFPPVNPVVTALIIDPFLRGLSLQERKSAAFKIAIYGFLICGGTLLIGIWLFKFF